MKRSEKFVQANREAKATWIALAVVILFWYLAGFGLADVEWEFMHTPLWVIGGCIGTWLFSVFVCWFLITFIFKDMDLEDEEEVNHD